MARTLFVPKKRFLIDGLEDEVGVKSYGAIYIRSDSGLYDYVLKIIGVFLRDDTEESRVLLEIFLGNIFDSRILEKIYSADVNTDNVFRQMMEDRFVRISDELLARMWSKIDLQEFTEVVLSKNYSLYSIDNWSRTNEPI